MHDPAALERDARVGYVLKQFPRLSETFVLNEILTLEELGWDIAVTSLRPPLEGKFHPGLGALRAPVRYSPSFSRSSAYATMTSLPDFGMAHVAAAIEFVERLHPSRRSDVLVAGADVARWAQETSRTHLHAHFLTVAAHVTYVAHLLTGIAFTVTCHAKDIYRTDIDWSIAQEIGQAAATLVTVCDANRRHMRERLPGVDIAVVYNGVDAAPPVAPSTRLENRVLAVGRLVEKKGFDTLIEAAPLVRDAIPEVEIVIAGDGDQRDHLEHLVASTGMAGVVRFTGAVTSDRVAKLMRSARVLAAPCRIGADGSRDALPTVLLEALAHGLPAVTTPVVGIPEIIEHDVAGLIIPPDDPPALAEALVQLLTDRGRWSRLAQAGPRVRASKFDRVAAASMLGAVFLRAARTPVAARGAA